MTAENNTESQDKMTPGPADFVKHIWALADMAVEAAEGGDCRNLLFFLRAHCKVLQEDRDNYGSYDPTPEDIFHEQMRIDATWTITGGVSHAIVQALSTLEQAKENQSFAIPVARED